MGVRGELFSTKVSLQNRTYFFNVKENRLGDLYLNIVESKNRDEGGFERQSVILFAEDLQEFLQGFDESLQILERAVREQRRGKKTSREPSGRDAPPRGARGPSARGSSAREASPRGGGRPSARGPSTRESSPRGSRGTSPRGASPRGTTPRGPSARGSSTRGTDYGEGRKRPGPTASGRGRQSARDRERPSGDSRSRRDSPSPKKRVVVRKK